MRTNITFEHAASLPVANGMVARNAGQLRATLATKLAAALRALTRPTPLSKTGRAFNHAYQALPLPR